MSMVSPASSCAETHPEAGVVAPAQVATPRADSRGKWLLCATAVVAVGVAVPYVHVQDWLQAAPDWIGQLRPLGPVMFVGLYVLASWVGMMPGPVL